MIAIKVFQKFVADFSNISEQNGDHTFGFNPSSLS